MKRPTSRIRDTLAAPLSLLLAVLVSAPALAITQDKAVVALHVQGHATKNLCTTAAPVVPCSQYTTEFGGAISDVYLVVARADPSRGIAGASLGIDYDGTPGSGVFAQAWVNCADLTFSAGSWPDPGTGITITWAPVSNCQTTTASPEGVHAVLGVLYIYAYGPNVIEITDNLLLLSEPELRIADCDAQETVLRPNSAGRVGVLGATGFNPCGACVTVSASDVTMTAGSAFTIPVTVENCVDAVSDVVLNCTVDGVPEAPVALNDMASGEIRVYNLPVTCLPPGSFQVDCTADAALDSDPSSTDSDMASVTVTCTGGPYITSVQDVGNDQGRSVRITFYWSTFDQPGSPTPITQYEAFRRIDPLPSNLPSPGRMERARELGMQSSQDILLAGWDYVGAVPAHGELEYNLIAPTLADAPFVSYFFIRAATSSPYTFYDSPQASGSSTDNLAPGPPMNLAMSPSGVISWNEATDPDFDYFSIYGSISPVFEESPGLMALAESAVLVKTTTETSYDVTQDFGAGGTRPYEYYFVAATDLAGNRGVVSAITSTLVAPDDTKPGVFALGQNVPNPFQSSTRIQFDLPEPAEVRLLVFDVTGKWMLTLIEAALPAGRHHATWDGNDSMGRPAPTGIYFFRIEGGSQIQMRKTMLIR